MSSQRQKRADHRAKYKNPINVTIIEAGVRKVLSWKQYQEFLNPKVEVN